MLQNRGLSRLILKNTLGLCTVLSGVHFPFRRSPFIPGTTKHRNISMTQKTFSSSINQVFLIHRYNHLTNLLSNLHVGQVLLSIAVSGSQLEEGWHRRRRRRGYGRGRWVPEAAVVGVALGERSVGVRPGCRVWHGGVGQAVVICFTRARGNSE